MFPHEAAALRSGQFVVRDNALRDRDNLTANCWVREQSFRLQSARVGTQADYVEIARNDEITWLTKEFMESAETGNSNPLFDFFRTWRRAVEEALSFESTRVSIQLARYSKEGAKYVRHADAAHDNAENATSDRRLVTLVYYLNPIWNERNGGQLRVYHPSCVPQGYYDVAPINNRFILFPSTMEHEVLPSYQFTRWAATMWIYGRSDLPARITPSSVLPITNLGSIENDTIFVSIASFCDLDMINTINDLISRAQRPERLVFGVCWQGGSNLDFSRILARDQVRWILLDAGDAHGPLFARNKILDGLYRGERYLLQIDAHTRTVQDWDARLITQLTLCGSPKPVLTAYPPGFSVDNNETRIDERLLLCPTPLLCADRFDDAGFLRITGRDLAECQERPLPSYFWAAGFSFCEARAFFEGDRPNIPDLFFGEETLMALYLYSHGWDFFCPGGTNLFFHYWKSRSQKPETALNISGENRLRARSKYLQLLKKWTTEKCSPFAIRTLSEYESFTGIDFAQKMIEERAKLGGRESWMKFKIAAPLPQKAISLIEQFL